ncbi:MAG: hypothetical protein KGJ66_03115 [Alphaproteobacteria bacterium]|nr:hypothetical protein [Alphaproteobacteria bacterium]
MVLAAAIALLAIAAPARAEVVTLICRTNSEIVTLTIDFANQTVCSLEEPVQAPPCSVWPSKWTKITDRFITFGSNVLDRVTGIIRLADRSTGTCQRAGKPVL